MKAVAHATAFFFCGLLAPLAAFSIIEFPHSLLTSDLYTNQKYHPKRQTSLKVGIFEDGVRSTTSRSA